MMLDKEQIGNWEGEPEEPAKPRKAVASAEPPKSEPAAPAAPAPEARHPAPHVSILGAQALPTGETVKLTPEQEKARKRRSHWIALALFAFVILVFVITMARLGANVLVRDL